MSRYLSGLLWMVNSQSWLVCIWWACMDMKTIFTFIFPADQQQSFFTSLFDRFGVFFLFKLNVSWKKEEETTLKSASLKLLWKNAKAKIMAPWKCRISPFIGMRSRMPLQFSPIFPISYLDLELEVVLWFLLWK